ncbi:MAG: PorT family protein [Aureispira sp.]|nr:PorT family protein [Aureispira sp.]
MNLSQKSTIYLLLMAISCSFYQLNAQDGRKIKFGLRAGTNISTVFGPSEEGADEKYKVTAKIVAGALVKIPFNDRFGFMGEVDYIQKGTYHRFEATDSYLKLPGYGNQAEVTYQGNKDWKKIIGVNLINSYVEVPLLFYAQPIKDKLEFEVGPSFSFLVSSVGLGTLKYGETLDNEIPDPSKFFEFDLDYKFFKDKVDEVGNDFAKSAKLNGSTRTYPQGPKAYYFQNYPETATDPINPNDYTVKGSTTYSVFDIGINVGASFFFTPGLRIGARANIGLIDISVDKYDISNKELNTDGTFKLTNHFDQNFGVQIFVGLQF